MGKSTHSRSDSSLLSPVKCIPAVSNTRFLHDLLGQIQQRVLRTTEELENFATRIIVTPKIKAREKNAQGEVLAMCKNSQNKKMRGEGGIRKAESNNCTKH